MNLKNLSDKFQRLPWVLQIGLIILVAFIIFGTLGTVISPQGQKSFKEGQGAESTISKPSSTSTPTNTPAPTPYSKIILKDDPQKYLDYSEKMQSFFTEQAEASEGIVTALDKWPYLTNEEVIELASNTVIAEKSYETVKAISPPTELVSTHQKFINGYKIYSESMPLLRSGLDNEDDSLIKQATNKMSQGGTIVKKALEEFDTFTKSLN